MRWKLERGMERIIVGKMKVGEKRWRVVGVYVERRGIEKTLQELDE